MPKTLRERIKISNNCGLQLRERLLDEFLWEEPEIQELKDGLKSYQERVKDSEEVIIRLLKEIQELKNKHKQDLLNLNACAVKDIEKLQKEDQELKKELNEVSEKILTNINDLQQEIKGINNLWEKDVKLAKERIELLTKEKDKKGIRICELLIGLQTLQKENKEQKKEINKLREDHLDMFGAYNTTFYRCKCGHLKEKGLQCPNNKCIY